MSGVSFFGHARYTITGLKGLLCSLQRFVIHIPYYVSLGDEGNQLLLELPLAQRARGTRVDACDATYARTHA